MDNTSSESNNIIYHLIQKPEQCLYDAFNMLMFDKTNLVIQKLITKITIYNNVKDLYGDILEFGVFKGASLALWLQLKKMYEPNSSTKIIGFDFYNCSNTLSSLNENDQNITLMKEVLSRVDENDLDINNIKKKCDNILDNSTILIKGDASLTSKEFNNNNPGARIKLLYLDMDVEEPTYNVLHNLWDKVVIGGQIILDEYGHHKWDESNGADKFLKKIPNKYKLTCTNVSAPTLIITKLEL
uniref:Macrocin O-methyltransferase n=1 Tax=viral metagenome TaxID=1070528 RepID=A0A6C0BA87_9ZZZZ